MPYNSSAFEKQLEAHKKKLAGVKDEPEDAHLAKSKVIIGRGDITPNAVQDSEDEAPAKKAAEPAEPTVTVIYKTESKPFYKQGWFMFLLFSAVTTAAIPMTFKSHLDSMMGMADVVSEQTGFNIFSLSSYKKAEPAEAPVQAHATASTVPTEEPAAKKPFINLDTLKPALKEALQKKTDNKSTQIQTTNDLHSLVDQASAKAAEVTSQGPEQSMQYIQEESERLNAMAKQFDETYGKKK